MRNYLLIAMLFIATFSVAQKREDRSGGSFSEISIGIPANVTIVKGKTHKVELEGEEDDLDEIETEINGGKLKFSSKNDSWWGGFRSSSRINIYITTPELDGIALSGSGTVESNDVFTSDEFEADISGSGKMFLNIQANEADIDISGSGKVILQGSAKEADISISGSGDVEAENFKINEAEVNIMGSGNCTLHVTESLESKIMGSGSLRYAGDPKHVNNNTMGSGRVKKL